MIHYCLVDRKIPRSGVSAITGNSILMFYRVNKNWKIVSYLLYS